MADVDSSMLLFCKEIKKAGFNYALSGECSDEIFGGYPWYYKENLVNSDTFPWSTLIQSRCKMIKEELICPNYLTNYINNAYNETCKGVVYNSPDIFENNFRKLCYLTTKWFMNTLIERTNRLSKVANLEVIIPFADYKLFEYVYNISAKFKLGIVNGNSTPIEKYVLRKAFDKELPQEIVYRKKSPFPKTYDPKYLKLLEYEIGKIISSSTAPLLDIINVKFLLELLNTKGELLGGNLFGQLMTYPQTLAYLIQINMWLEEFKPIIEI